MCWRNWLMCAMQCNAMKSNIMVFHGKNTFFHSFLFSSLRFSALLLLLLFLLSIANAIQLHCIVFRAMGSDIENKNSNYTRRLYVLSFSFIRVWFHVPVSSTLIAVLFDGFNCSCCCFKCTRHFNWFSIYKYLISLNLSKHSNRTWPPHHCVNSILITDTCKLSDWVWNKFGINFMSIKQKKIDNFQRLSNVQFNELFSISMLI